MLSPFSLSTPYLTVFMNLFSFVIFIAITLIYRFIYPKKAINPFLLVFMFSFLPVLSLLRSGMPDSHDFLIHTVLTSQFYTSLLEGNISPQWADGSPGGYGYPVFIYFYQLPYYLGSIFLALGFGLINSVKLVLISAFLLSCTTMYFWAKDEFDRWGAVVVTIFYQLTSYHLIETHTFTAFGETVAFAILPLSFLTVRRFLITKKYTWFAAAAVSFALAILAHHSLGLIGLPLLVIYALLVWKEHGEKIRILLLSYLSLFVGIVLTAYYWLPLLMEEKFVTEKLYHIVNFEPFWNFIYSPWGFGLLYQGHDARIRWVIGYAHLLVVFLVILLLVKKLIRSKERNRAMFYLLSFVVLFIAMQQIASPLWSLPMLQNFRSTIRLLLFESFFTAALAGFVYTYRKQILAVIPIYPFAQVIDIWVRQNILRQRNVRATKKDFIADAFVVTLCVLAILTSVLHWATRIMLPATDATIRRDYIPTVATGEVIPIWLTEDHANLTYLDQIRTNKHIEILAGKATVTELSRTTTSHTYRIDTSTGTTMKENTLYFPGWTVRANGQTIPIDIQTPKYPGILVFTLPNGTHTVDVLFLNTPIRQLAERISLAALLGLFLYPLLSRIFLRQRN